MLEEVLTHIHNWFRVRDSVDGIHPGEYTIQDGSIALPFLRDGQYFRIMGSLFSDGLHRYGPAMEYLEDETFTGTIWALAIPPAVIRLSHEIADWQEKYGAVIDSPYTSESFGGYQYSKSTSAESGTGAGWETTFRAKLNRYRKIGP